MHPEHVAIVGAGAVGCYFGGMLARAGIPVTLIGRAHHIEAIQRDGLYLERKDFQEFVRLGAETEISKVGGATIVLLSVKTVATETAAADVSCRITNDIAAELWTKLVMNCAYNASSAVAQSRYGAIKNNPLSRGVVEELIREVVLVGRASGVSLPSVEQLVEATLKLG